MEENGNLSLNALEEKINTLRDLKRSFLSRMTSENKKDINYWTRQMDKEIRSCIKARDSLLKKFE